MREAAARVHAAKAALDLARAAVERAEAEEAAAGDAAHEAAVEAERLHREHYRLREVVCNARAAVTSTYMRYEDELEHYQRLAADEAARLLDQWKDEGRGQ
jgi:hypothetical protein